MVIPPERWRAAVCYDSPIITRKVREALDRLGWDYVRDRAEHHYSRLMIVITIPSASYIFRFAVTDPVEFNIDIYDEKPTHTGIAHYIEISGLNRGNASRVRRLLQEFASSLPRKPYEFFWQERFRTGFLYKGHLTARRDWSRWGI